MLALFNACRTCFCVELSSAVGLRKIDLLAGGVTTPGMIKVSWVSVLVGVAFLFCWKAVLPVPVGLDVLLSLLLLGSGVSSTFISLDFPELVGESGKSNK